MAATQPTGALLAKYLVGLGFLLAGLVIVLVGIVRDTGVLLLFGAGLAALGLFLVVLKIIARNQPP
jgi:hypothetical protein